LNRPRSWPFTIEAIEVRPRTAVPAAAATAAFVAAPDEALRASARKLGVDDLGNAAGGERDACEGRRASREFVCD
jgi:hypothetical protein